MNTIVEFTFEVILPVLAMAGLGILLLWFASMPIREATLTCYENGYTSTNKYGTVYCTRLVDGNTEVVKPEDIK